MKDYTINQIIRDEKSKREAMGKAKTTFRQSGMQSATIYLYQTPSRKWDWTIQGFRVARNLENDGTIAAGIKAIQWETVTLSK